MERKTLIWIGLAIGSTVGGFIPSLWGASMFSLWSTLLSALGGVLGIWAGFKASEYM